MSPSNSVSARLMVRTTASSGDSRPPGNVGMPVPTWRISTGKTRPDARTTGASPNNFATAAPSSVADITSRRSSGARFSCESSANASPVSACRLRS